MRRARALKESALEAAWRADADHVPHEEPEIDAGGMNQQPLADVRVSAEVHAAHPAGFKEMSEGPFQAFAAQPQQPLAAGTANAPAIPIHGIARGRVLLPVPPPAGIGFERRRVDPVSSCPSRDRPYSNTAAPR